MKGKTSSLGSAGSNNLELNLVGKGLMVVLVVVVVVLAVVLCCCCLR